MKTVISDRKSCFRCILGVLGENRDFRTTIVFSVHSPSLLKHGVSPKHVLPRALAPVLVVSRQADCRGELRTDGVGVRSADTGCLWPFEEPARPVPISRCRIPGFACVPSCCQARRLLGTVAKPLVTMRKRGGAGAARNEGAWPAAFPPPSFFSLNRRSPFFA